jgi:hypothetical protein
MDYQVVVSLVATFALYLALFAFKVYVAPGLNDSRLQSLAYMFVTAAEQFMATETGEDKYNYVLGQLSERTGASEGELKAAIEWAVKELKEATDGKLVQLPD